MKCRVQTDNNRKKRANNTAKVQALSLDQKAHSIHISAHWPSEIPQESKVLSVCGALEKCFTNFQQEQEQYSEQRDIQQASNCILYLYQSLTTFATKTVYYVSPMFSIPFRWEAFCFFSDFFFAPLVVSQASSREKNLLFFLYFFYLCFEVAVLLPLLLPFLLLFSFLSSFFSSLLLQNYVSHIKSLLLSAGWVALFTSVSVSVRRCVL